MNNRTVAETHIQLVTQRLFAPVGIQITSPLQHEQEGTAYGACTFELDGRWVCFRVAKKTPTKNGQFVTFWRRVLGRILPLQENDLANLFLVSVSERDHFGQFVFSKRILCEQKVLTTSGGQGKLAMRVYPPWVDVESKQAAATQQWQQPYFLNASQGSPLDLKKAARLFQISTL